MSKSYNFVTEVESESSGKRYTIKVDENGLFSCSCPSWIFNTRRNRTCKHIDSLRGDVNLDVKGRLIVGVDENRKANNKVLILCKNYPEQCKECNMRFICWTQRESEFKLNDLRTAGVYHDR